MTHQRPVNLDLPSIRLYSNRFPLTAIASILHRISGITLFFGVGLLLWLLGSALSSAEGFVAASAAMDNFFVAFVIWGVLTALSYHFCSGIRHLFMDFGVAEESLSAAELSAKVTFAATAVLSLLAGVLVW